MYESGSYGGLFIFFWLALYFYYTGCQFTIANKLGHKYPWWSFIPVLNVYQIVELAGKAWYWFVFYFIPFVNIVAHALVWVDIAKARYKSPVWGVLMLIPFLNLVALLVMAMGDAPKAATPETYQKPESVREPADVI